MFKIFTFVKNEQHIIRDWLLYHASVVGCDNLFVVDNGSTDDTNTILQEWVNRGLNYTRYEGAFINKHLILSHLIKKHAKDCFVVPLDCDEFIVLKTKNGISINREDIVRAFRRQSVDDGYRYKLHQFDVVPVDDVQVDVSISQLSLFDEKQDRLWLDRFAKTFYHGRWFVSTDQGNHHGMVRGANTAVQTKLALLHYNIRSYKHFVDKTIKGAQAYGHHKHVIPAHGLGVHYHRRYWAIKNGRGVDQMNKEFGCVKPVSIDAMSTKLKQLYEVSDNNKN